MRIELEETFEEYLMKKYPELFPQDDQGNTLPSSCGVGGQEEWREIIDNLCGSIVEYTKNSKKSVKTKNKKKLLLYFLWSKVWMPIHSKLYKILDPYSPFKPKDCTNNIWIIRPEIRIEAEKLKRYKWRSYINKFTNQTIQPKDVYSWEPSCSKVTIAQIKSKFGELRFYVDGGDDAVHGMIRFAEYLCQQETEKKSKTLG